MAKPKIKPALAAVAPEAAPGKDISYRIARVQELVKTFMCALETNVYEPAPLFSGLEILAEQLGSIAADVEDMERAAGVIA